MCGFLFGTWVFGIRAYDRAAIKFRGMDADINFSISDYDEDIKQVASLLQRHCSSGALLVLSVFLFLCFLLLFWGSNTLILSGLQMSNFTKEEFVHILRRQSTGFSRGSSKYRGVTLHKCGRWEARMGQLLGKK